MNKGFLKLPNITYNLTKKINLQSLNLKRTQYNNVRFFVSYYNEMILFTLKLLLPLHYLHV